MTRADILAQNTVSGDIGVALETGATGTSFTAFADVANPGAGWTAIGTGEPGLMVVQPGCFEEVSSSAAPPFGGEQV